MNDRKIRVGIPRALYFFKHFSLWESLLTQLGCEIILSPISTQKILERGSEFASNELCVPVKLYYGQILTLIKDYQDKIDYIFVPNYVSTDKNHFFCPKFMALPNTVRKAIGSEIPVLVWEINKKKTPLLRSVVKLGEKLGVSENDSKSAFMKALNELGKFQKELKKGLNLPDLMENQFEKYIDKRKRTERKYVKDGDEDIDKEFPISILVLGHSYNTYEPIINQNLLERLNKFHVNTIMLENIPIELERKNQIIFNEKFYNYWENEKELLNAANYYLERKNDIDGVIFLISFACGPDSLIQELIMRDFKKNEIPYLELVLDEHSGESGVITRVESFIEMIRRKKYKNFSAV